MAGRQGMLPRSLLMQTAILSRRGHGKDADSATAAVPLPDPPPNMGAWRRSCNRLLSRSVQRLADLEAADAASRAAQARYTAMTLRARRSQARTARASAHI